MGDRRRMTAKLAVAVAQIETRPGDLEANLRKHLDVIDAARAAGVEVLLFPELSLTGHGAGSEALELAIDARHAAVLQIAERSASMCTVFGIIEERSGARFFNTAVAVRGGAPVFAHRKVNLATYGKLDDGKHFGAGETVELLPLDDDWRAGVMVCADMWNPALVHLVALQGATLLLAPVSSALEAVGDGFDNVQGWETNLRFHALTYGMPVAMANRVGAENGLTFWGGSRILDPFARVVASATGMP
jgi:predicted amidohydrolase